MRKSCDYQCIKNESLFSEELKNAISMVGIVGKGVISCGKYSQRLVDKMCADCRNKHELETKHG